MPSVIRTLYLTLKLLLWLALLAIGPALAADTARPVARAGVLDLRGWNFAAKGDVALDGTWQIHWGRFLDPAAQASGGTPFKVPGPWDALQHEGRPVGSDGHATYTLTVLCNSADRLALLAPAQHSAMHLYANGVLVVQQGQPGATPDSARPKVSTRIGSLSQQRCPLRIVAHVSNFNHRNGGMVRGLHLGDERAMSQQRGRALAFDVALMSAFFVTGLLPIAFFLLRRQDRAPLWFGLFCLSMAVYIGFGKERSLESLLVDLGWEAYLKFEYLGWYFASPCFLLFVRGLYPKEVDRRIVYGYVGLMLAASAFVLVAPARLYSFTVPVVQGITVLGALYAVVALGLARLHRQPGGSAFFIGMAVFAVVVVIDIAHYNDRLQWSATPLGVLVFSGAAAFALAQRFARALGAEELRGLEQRHRVNLLVRATQAGILDWDATSNAVTYSERYKEMLGYPADADTSQWPMFFDTAHPDERERVREGFLGHLRDRSVRSGHREHEAPDFRLRHADGRYVWVHAKAISLTGTDGRTLRYVCSFIDVTERRRMTDQLARQNKMLKENVRLREEVERIGRHDLKTPLNSIIAVPRLLREQGRLQPEDEELVGIVERAGYRILNLVNLSLDMLRMEQGRYQCRAQPVDLLDVLRTVCADVRTHAASKGVRIDITLDGAPAGAAPVHAWAEELLCYSILANLMKNAIEAAPEGSAVSVALRTGDSLTLAIHNLGAVPPALRERFFDKYATAGKSDGTGLGTYSARLMARIQGGELTMRTGDAQGTTLTLRLRPATAAQAIASQQSRAAMAPWQPPLKAEQLPSCRVLVVDDDEFNLLVMRRYLPAPPLQVSTAVNGRAAIVAALQSPPDLVLIDLDMPVMDGIEATRTLRTLQREGRLPHCPIVMLSSHDDGATQQRALEAGCERYLTKPVSRETLLHTVHWAVTGRDDAPVEAAAAPGPADVAIDPELLDQMPAFLTSRRQLLAALAAERDNPGAVRRHAHRLAGSFSLYGLHWAAAQCRRVERGELAPAQIEAWVEALGRHLDLVQSRTPDQAERSDAGG